MKTIKQAAARQALEAMKEMGLHSSTYAAEGRAFAATKATARKFLQRIQKAAGEIGKASQEDGEQATSLLCQISPYPRQLVFKGWHDLESWLGEVETLLESVAGYEEVKQ